jgi:hypothetical protein
MNPEETDSAEASRSSKYLLDRWNLRRKELELLKEEIRILRLKYPSPSSKGRKLPKIGAIPDGEKPLRGC